MPRPSGLQSQNSNFCPCAHVYMWCGTGACVGEGLYCSTSEEKISPAVAEQEWGLIRYIMVAVSYAHAHAYYQTYMSQREQQPFSTSSPSREDRMKGPFVLLLTAKVVCNSVCNQGLERNPAPLGSPVGQAGVEMAHVNKVYI